MTTLDERLTADLERMADERDAARENARRAIQERDDALVKLAKVAALCTPCARESDPQDPLCVDGECHEAVCILARQVREAIGSCPTCGILGRIADAPCTHLGRGRHAS